jgi:predicted PurR-regulated permease PerM
VLLLLLAGCLLVVIPFLSAILWAVVLVFSSWRIYERLLARVKNRHALAALIMTLGMIVILLVPFLVVGGTIADNVQDVSEAIRRWKAEGVHGPPGWVAKLPLIGNAATNYWQSLVEDTTRLVQLAKQALPTVTVIIVKLVAILGNGLLELTVSIFIAFFLFRDGAAAGEVLRNIVLRIAGERGGRYLTVAGNTVRGVVYGILGTALVQALMAGVGFFVSGVPGPGLLGLLTFFLSPVPVGPVVIWVPAAIWLFHQGRTGWGVFMIIWGVGVSSIDNVIKPWLISQGVRMPFLLIIFGVIGGAVQFGLIGVFLGPTLLAVAHGMLQEWMASKQQTEAPTLNTTSTNITST